MSRIERGGRSPPEFGQHPYPHRGTRVLYRGNLHQITGRRYNRCITQLLDCNSLVGFVVDNFVYGSELQVSSLPRSAYLLAGSPLGTGDERASGRLWAPVWNGTVDWKSGDVPTLFVRLLLTFFWCRGRHSCSGGFTQWLPTNFPWHVRPHAGSDVYLTTKVQFEAEAT